jgi:hypothetical protein
MCFLVLRKDPFDGVRPHLPSPYSTTPLVAVISHRSVSSAYHSILREHLAVLLSPCTASAPRMLSSRRSLFPVVLLFPIYPRTHQQTRLLEQHQRPRATRPLRCRQINVCFTDLILTYLSADMLRERLDRHEYLIGILTLCCLKSRDLVTDWRGRR